MTGLFRRDCHTFVADDVRAVTSMSLEHVSHSYHGSTMGCYVNSPRMRHDPRAVFEALAGSEGVFP